MRIFFWDYDDVNDIAREWAMFSINFLACLFTLNALISTYRYHRRFIFELVPLSVNFLATFILLNLKLFERGYQFDEIGYLVEIFTYFLFCYTFGLMYAKVIQTSSSKIISRIFNILLVIFVILFFTFTILVVTKVISKSCDRYVFGPALISFIAEVASFIPTLIFGTKILRNLIKTQNKDKLNNSQTQIDIFSSSSDQYIRERKKQVVIVIVAYTISVIVRGSLLIFTNFFDYLFTCSQIDGIFIITSDQVSGQIILVVIQLNQLLPHIMIPIALYIIPIRKSFRSKSIKLEETLIDQGDQNDKSENSDDGQAIKRRISSSLLSSRDQIAQVNKDQKFS